MKKSYSRHPYRTGELRPLTLGNPVSLCIFALLPLRDGLIAWPGTYCAAEKDFDLLPLPPLNAGIPLCTSSHKPNSLLGPERSPGLALSPTITINVHGSSPKKAVCADSCSHWAGGRAPSGWPPSDKPSCKARPVLCVVVKHLGSCVNRWV